MLRDRSCAVESSRRGVTTAAVSHLRRAVRHAWERLESRTLLTSVLYVDFGDNLPAGGFDLSANQLKDDFGSGGIQGPDLTAGSNSDPLAGDDNLQFTSLSTVVNFDYNNDGTANAQDYTDLKNAIIQLTQRYYAPFDVTVQVVPNLDTSSDTNYRNAIISQLQQGANSDGERDAYVLCGTWTDTTLGVDVGNDEGLNGKAAGPDITNNNARDDSAMVFASNVINGLSATQADTALAHDVAHEAGHTFGLEHSNDGGGAGNNSLLTGTDVIRVGGNQGVALTNFNTFTRFPLPKDANTAQNVNSYDRLNDPNLLGHKAGFPAYVTGTGAPDIITVTSTGAGTASIKVQAFTTSAYTTQIGGDYTYSINTGNGILIETGASNDRIVIDGSLGTTVTARGEGGTDSLVVQGNNAATGSYTPGATSGPALDDQTDFSGTIVVGSTTINLQEIASGGTVTVSDVGTFNYVTPNPGDTVTFNTPAAGQNQVIGTSGGTAMVPLIFSKIGDFTIDTGTNDGAGGSPDSVVLNASSLATGLQKLSVNTGGGDDELRVNFGTGNPVPANGLFFDGGGGTNDLLTLFGGNFTNDTYTPSGPSSGTVALDSSLITYSNLAPINDTTSATDLLFNATAAADVINVVNGPAPGGVQETQINSGNGTFERLNFANKTDVTINGQSGADTFNHTATLTADGLATITLNGQNTGNVGDDNAADAFNFSGTLAGVPTTASGGGGADAFTVTGTAANPALTLSGESGDDTFTVTGSGAGGAITANGDVGSDTFNVTGLGVSAGSVNLNGQAEDDTFNVTSSPSALINVDGGGHLVGDTLNVNGESLDYTINLASITASGRQAINYFNTEALGLTSGTFGVPGTIGPDVNVKDGAKLYGTGTVLGAVSTLADGVVSPGVSIGTATGVLNTGNVSLAATSSYQLQVNGLADGTEHDVLHVTGTVNLGGANLDLTTGTTVIPGDEVLIVDNDGADPIVGKFAQGDLITVGAQKFAIDYAYDGDGDGIGNDVALIRYGAALAPDPCDPTKQALFVSATTAADQIRLIGQQGNNNIRVLITTAGVTDDLGVFSPTGLLITFGQAGNDVISVEVPSRASWLYGQGGDDLLRAGNNDSVLIGGLGDDHLVSGNGKDVLIGSQGADMLEAGNGDDLLIAGPTAFDANNAANRSAICNIDDEWTGGTGGWKGHIDHLTTGGGKNGTTLLNSTTVFDDGAADNLLGQAGKDWFLMNRTGGGTLDSSDADKNESVTDV